MHKSNGVSFCRCWHLHGNFDIFPSVFPFVVGNKKMTVICCHIQRLIVKCTHHTDIVGNTDWRWAAVIRWGVLHQHIPAMNASKCLSANESTCIEGTSIHQTHDAAKLITLAMQIYSWNSQMQNVRLLNRAFDSINYMLATQKVVNFAIVRLTNFDCIPTMFVPFLIWLICAARENGNFQWYPSKSRNCRVTQKMAVRQLWEQIARAAATRKRQVSD